MAIIKTMHEPKENSVHQRLTEIHKNIMERAIANYKKKLLKKANVVLNVGASKLNKS